MYHPNPPTNPPTDPQYADLPDGGVEGRTQRYRLAATKTADALAAFTASNTTAIIQLGDIIQSDKSQTTHQILTDLSTIVRVPRFPGQPHIPPLFSRTHAPRSNNPSSSNNSTSTRRPSNSTPSATTASADSPGRLSARNSPSRRRQRRRGPPPPRSSPASCVAAAAHRARPTYRPPPTTATTSRRGGC